MEKKHKIAQVYAVIICIIAIITIIISIGDLVSSIIDSKNPLYSNRTEEKLTSFEYFKMDAMKSVTKEQAYIPDDQTLLKMYESARNEKIQSVLHQTNRSIIVDSLLIG
ncbi:MAG: hypothetical protein Q8S44_09530, partial [Flavobacteriaceae bacterium]|nr:hypothetical protein [Flavobacteriaceae bacterium]